MEMMPAIAETFAALGNGTRLAIVERLLREGELAAGDIGAETDISAPAMSHHFKVLRDAGILTQRVDGQRRLYAVRPEAMRAIGVWSLTYRQFWDQSLDRLGAALNKDKPK
jgi:DNA-binding transcriptional ArsR family regulator